MPQWVIRHLQRSDQRSTFDCGNEALNDWLAHRAGQFERKNLARTYVLMEASGTLVVGYYAISNHSVSFESLPTEQSKGLPRMSLPAVLLGRLAVDRSAQGRGLGSLLLIDALRRAQYVSEQVGIRAVEVHAIDETARTFYVKHGFMPLLDDAHHLFLPLETVRKLGLPPLPST
jgi:GNAT superfamily N-acetyltransferase